MCYLFSFLFDICAMVAVSASPSDAPTFIVASGLMFGLAEILAQLRRGSAQ